MFPLISVVMSTYNRAKILSETIESILAQTYDNFEFIIINDSSNDNTKDIIQKYSDNRIKLFNNKKNCGCTFNYHTAQNIAKGKYIAHIDDDDISYPKRLEKQIKYMEENTQVALLGTFIETFGENKRPTWVFYKEPKEIYFAMHLYNPICHSSIMYRKSFLEKHAINYDITKRCSQDYDLYKQIILQGGIIANLDEILVKYRMHKNRLTDMKETQDIQILNAEQIKKELLTRFIDMAELEKYNNLIKDFPFNNYNKEQVVKAIRILSMSMKTRGYDYTKISEKIIKDIQNNLFKF